MISPLKEYRRVKGCGERIPEWSYLELDGRGCWYGTLGLSGESLLFVCGLF